MIRRIKKMTNASLCGSLLEAEVGVKVDEILKVSSTGVSRTCRAAERSEHTELVEPE